MKKTMIVFIALVMMLAVSPAFAQTDSEETPIHHYPKIAPEFSLMGGYWFIDVDGSNRAAEYLYTDESPSFGGSVIAFPFPHRIHLEADFTNEKDYFSDVRYAYKDLVLLRTVNRGLFHNFGNIELVPGSYGVTRLDVGKEYGYKTNFGEFGIRLKMPHYPLHAYAKGFYMSKDGDHQQRFMGGCAYFGPCGLIRVSDIKNIDRLSTDISLGINSHLGPVEAEYSHSERRFEHDEGIDSYVYAAGGNRGAGTYPHNVIPELKGSTDTVKVHTSYTGRLVASATFSVSEDENETSSASTDYYLAAGEAVWTPTSKLTTALRYKYEKRDVDNPNSLPANYLGFPAFGSYAPPLTGIRNSISADINTVSIITRYRPTGKITLGADASYKHTERENAGEWGIEDSTDETNLGASVRWRLHKSLTFKARYKYKTYEDPAYNIQSDDAHRGDVSVTWTPVPRVIVFAGYVIAREKRDHIHILVGGAPSGVEDRRVYKDSVTAAVTFVISEKLTLTGTYGYWNNKVRQDIALSDTGGNPIPDNDVEYSDTTNNYSASVDFYPIEQLHLHAGASYTESEGGFNPKVPEALLPVSIASFSRMEIKEMAVDFETQYEFPRNFELGFRFEYRDFDDVIENPLNPEVQDGSAYVYLVTLNKRW